jgi:DNA-binding MarR family transcriptional regulator
MKQEREQELPLPALILHLYREQARLYEQHLGMSQSRLLLLRELSQRGEVSQAELARRLDMEATLVTRFAKHMEASGLLTRRSDPRDNRFTLVTLTAAGQHLSQQMMAFTHSLETQLVEGLSGEEVMSIKQALKQFQEKYSHMKEAGDETDLSSDHSSRTKKKHSS